MPYALSDGDDKDVYRGGETTSSVAQSTLSGSDPQLNKRSSSVQGDSDAASPGATTPADLASKARSYTRGWRRSSLGTLHAVKENLRRMRWQRERVLNISNKHSDKQ